MKLDCRPSHVDSWTGAGLEVVHRLIIESLRILDLRLLGFNPRMGFDNLQIGIAHGQRDYIERVFVAELGGLFGGAGGAEMLNRFVAEQGLAEACAHRTVAEWTNYRRDTGYLDGSETQSYEVHLINILVETCIRLREEIA